MTHGAGFVAAFRRFPNGENNFQFTHTQET
jgi:hypothetical protein